MQQQPDNSYFGFFKKKTFDAASIAAAKASALKESANEKLETTGVKAKVSSAAGTVSTNAKIIGATAYSKTSGVREAVGQKYTVRLFYFRALKKTQKYKRQVQKPQPQLLQLSRRSLKVFLLFITSIGRSKSKKNLRMAVKKDLRMLLSLKSLRINDLT